MSSISVYYSSNSTPFPDAAVSGSSRQSCSCTTRTTAVAFKSSFLGEKQPLLSARKPRTCRGSVKCSGLNSIVATSHTFDVVIIGAGIIGLTIARQLLIESNLSVAVVDRALPCSGATGAGQGYIWMAHKTPGSDTWDLSRRSYELWKTLAENLVDQGLNPLDVLGWRETGSMLIGRTPEELVKLKERVKQLSKAGLRAEYLSSSDLLLEEPELMVERDSGAAFLPDDCQIDAMRAVAYIEKVNRHFALEGRYAEFYHDPVTCLLRSYSIGEVEAVRTSKHTLRSKKAVIIAAGCWSGSLMQDLLKETEIVIDVPVNPRKGHLLVLENFDSLKLNHGLMEAGYVDHRHLTQDPKSVDQGQVLSISMTATMDSMGSLVLGSSRQFAGFNTEVDESIIHLIWKRAAEYFPKLRDVSLSDISRSRRVRVGLRPYMPDGKPVIGPVPNLSNVLLATGHEGGGLSMALGTAEMIADMVLGTPLKVDAAPFGVKGRCC